MVVLDISHSAARSRRIEQKLDRVVPQSVSGRFRRIKWAMLTVTLSVYYALPFLRWSRPPGEPDQAVLLDFANARLYAFGAEIWPQDLPYITGLLLLAALILVFANAVAGRVWCGFACPQTVWTDLFLLVERWIEGDRRERLRKQSEPLTPRRVAEIAAKHALWILISLSTGGALVFYFADAPALLRALFSGSASLQAYLWVATFASITYTLAGFAREQVCTFMCPWPRLQGAIWDADALTVNYRDYRGEPRTSARKALEKRARGEAAGDCVDCAQCVVVCPIGLDIRNGPSIACINCGLCVDACDGVMGKLGRSRGLIDFESWRNIEGGRRGEVARTRVVRPKTILLAAAVIALAGGMAVSFSLRADGALSIQHERSPRVILLSNGALRNAYELKLVNHAGRPRAFTIDLEGPPGAALEIVGRGRSLSVAPNASERVRVVVDAPAQADAPIRFVARDAEGHAFSGRDMFFAR